ncbi:MAG: Ig-like domain-containing protein [Eubacterium sp.]|nr:Ig-like domain-containing protein [Eubacterium sp.]
MKDVRVTSKKAIGFYRQWLLLMLCMMAAFGGTTVKAQTIETKEVIIEDDEPKAREYHVYLGQQVELPTREGVFQSKNDAVAVVKDGVLCAVGVGQTEVTFTADDETTTYCIINVYANPKLKSLTFQLGDLEDFVVGGGTYEIKVSAFEGLTCTFTSKTLAVVSVTENGVATPLVEGLGTIHVSVIDNYGGTYEYDIPIRVVKPEYEIQKTNLAVDCSTTLTVKNSGGKTITASSTNSKVVSVDSVEGNVITITALKAGQAVIVGALGNTAFSCIVNVTNPKMNAQYGFYEKNKKIQLKLTGLNSDSKPVWASGDKKVATVTQKGKVKTKKIGSTVIACVVDGKTLVYYLATGKKTVVKAMRYGFKQVGKKKYSQPLRMSKKYFDCSSFVYRAYRSAGKYLVEKNKWAPVAATIAKYYTQKGKRIKPSGKTYDLKKLRPGDLVCWGGNSAKKNGRYKRIYHIAMYIGNGLTMESSSAYNNVVIRDRGTFSKKKIPVIVRPC